MCTSRTATLNTQKAGAPLVHYITMFARKLAVSSTLRGASRVSRPQTREMGGGG
jgi:hypothetical protein